MSLRSRTKGKRGEQLACRILEPAFPSVRTKRAGGESADDDRGCDLRHTPGFTFQVKLAMRPNIHEALLEARRAAIESGTIPVAMCKRSQIGNGNSGPWTVTLLAEDLVQLLVTLRSVRQLAVPEAIRQVEENNREAIASTDATAVPGAVPGDNV